MKAIPGADGAGLTLLEAGRPDTIVATAPFVSEIDDIQYGLRQGPCITAASESQTVLSGSLGTDPRWRRFGSAVAKLGVHSVLSLPLTAPDGVAARPERPVHDEIIRLEADVRLEARPLTHCLGPQPRRITGGLHHPGSLLEIAEAAGIP